MMKVPVTFYVGVDWLNSEVVSGNVAVALPRIGETVEIWKAEDPVTLLPVQQVRHRFIDGGHEIDLLLYDESHQPPSVYETRGILSL